MPLTNASARRRFARPHARGIALFLVMVGLVVCSILTAGFLSTQGTSIGIARNERDAEKCRAYAQTGIDLAYWLITNRSDWRITMSPGKWLNNYAVGDGAVTVSAQDGDNTGSFSDDPTQSVILVSTGSYNGRTFTISSRVTPTGGGTVFGGGSFLLGQLALHNSSLIDSYNSAVAPYNALFPGSNALFQTNDNDSGALTIDSLFASYHGTFIGGPHSLLGSLLSLILGLLSPPPRVAVADEAYIPGTVIAPNTLGLTAMGSLSLSGAASTSPGQYDTVSVSSRGQMRVQSGIYRITGQSSFAGSIVVPSNAATVLILEGQTQLNGPITLGTGATLDIYIGADTSIQNAIINSSGLNSSLRILGLSSNTKLTISGGAQIHGAIYAPGAAIKIANTSAVYGAIVGNTIELDDSAQIHFDEALKTLQLHNVTSGSAPQGTADYIITRLGTL